MRKVFTFLAVSFVFLGCAQQRQSSQNLNWPASLATVSGFSSQEEDRVVKAVEQLNLKVHRTLVLPSSLTSDGTSSSQGRIHIQWVKEIPKTTIAGRATIKGTTCFIELTEQVASSDDYIIPVLWHEIGHCAGLKHTTDATDVMYRTSTTLSSYSQDSFRRFFNQIVGATGL